MDHSYLRTAVPSELALYLRTAASQRSAQAVTEELLAGIKEERLPPRIFTIWCSAGSEPEVVAAGLKQGFSRLVRRSAIARLGQLLRSLRCSETWTALGSTAGIVNFLVKASVKEVNQFCRVVRLAAASQKDRQRRQKCVEELFMALNPALFPDNALRTTDRRPLRTTYMNLLPACSLEFVERTCALGDDKFAKPAIDLCRPYHLAEYRQRALQKVDNNTGSLGDLIALAKVDDEYPPPQGNAGRLSSNMQFSIQVLDVLSVRDEMPSDLDHGSVLSDIVLPLFRRMWHWRTRSSTFARVVEMLDEYLRRHVPLHQQSVDLQRNGIVWYSVQRWARSPQTLLPSLETVLRLDRTKQQMSDPIPDLMRLASPPRRYLLLHTILRNVPMYKTDIDVDEELKELRFRWPPAIFQALSKHEARRLFERILKLRPADTYGHWSEQWRILRPQHTGDPTCLLLSLCNESPDIIEKATAAIEIRRKKAIEARQQPDRSCWARCACDLAIASGSIELYRDTVSWASARFAKDPLTSIDLHSDEALHTNEGIALLRGFPGSKHRILRTHLSEDDVRSRVKIGNDICEALFSSACQAIQEPSFQHRHWDAVLRLLGATAHSRIDHVNALQDALGLSDDVVYEVVFQPTLEMCLKLEKTGLQDELRKLYFRLLRGPLHNGGSGHDWKDLRPASLRFVDEIARRRDDLWVEYRQKETPEVMSLPPAFPRGLPVIQLISSQFPVISAKPKESLNLPYLRSRAESILFMNAESALAPVPTDDQVKRTVGYFVESWSNAFRLYLYTSDQPRQDALRVWNYATNTLSSSRMSPTEASVFWSKHFIDELRSYVGRSGGRCIYDGPWNDSYNQLPPYPTLPGPQETIDQPAEWDPDWQSASFEIKRKKLDPTCLDFMLRDHTSNWAHIEIGMQEVTAPAIERSIPPFWSRYSTKAVPPGVQEALMAAAFLLYGEVHKVSPGLLRSGFPSAQEQHPRFPPLYLAEEFLENHRTDLRGPHMVLQRFLINVPPTLLLRLAEAILETKDESNGSSIPYVAFSLLKLLSKGDRPEIALPIIQSIIVERTDSSSWHRQLLNHGLLQILPSGIARDLATGLATAINTRMADARKTKDTAESGSNNRQQPAVKVTTVKLLAQPLSQAEFIDESTTVDVLTSLLRDASHIDIRLAAIDALGKMLRKSTPSKLRDTILDVLEEHVLPMISGPDESRLTSDANWAEAEATPKELLPPVFSGIGALPPVLSYMVNLAHAMDIDDETRDALYYGVLIPALNRSRSANQKWLEIFYKRFDVSPMDLPELPFYPYMVIRLLKYHDFVPQWVLNMWYGIWRLYIAPPPQLKSLRERFQDDVELRESNAAQHWIISGKGLTIGDVGPMSLLRQKISPKGEAAFVDIQLSEVRNLALRQADDVLRTSTDPSLGVWNDCIAKKLYPPPRGKKSDFELWSTQCRPVIEILIERIDAFRTPEWQKDPRRGPPVLPTTFSFRLWLAVFPPAEEPRDIQGVGIKLSDLLDELANSGKPYVERFEEMKKFIVSRVIDEDKVLIALTLGRAMAEPYGLADYLRAEMIDHLIREVKKSPPVGELQAAVYSGIWHWTKSEDEEIRMRGLKLMAMTADLDGEEKMWFNVGP